MALLTSKADYALRALLHLAAQNHSRPVQSREIAARQDIPESYLNQLLVILRRAGLVRSIRGAAGGYVLGREPHRVTAADVLRALHGSEFLAEPPGRAAQVPSAWVVRGLESRLNDVLRAELERTTLADLRAEIVRQDEAQSVMLGL